jgi:prepilin-type N-terminal cleavage/methylation domain-containing protein
MRKRNHRKKPRSNSSGFTLIEIIAVLTILGIIGSITVGKVVALDSSATQRSFEWSIHELNSREQLTWSQIKITPSDWIDDLQIFGQTDHDLGPEYSWFNKTAGGGKLVFKGQELTLKRKPSTSTAPGCWKMN